MKENFVVEVTRPSISGVATQGSYFFGPFRSEAAANTFISSLDYDTVSSTEIYILNSTHAFLEDALG